MYANVLFLCIVRSAVPGSKFRGPHSYLICDGLVDAASGYIYFITSEAITAYPYPLGEYYYALYIFFVKLVCK